MSFGTFVLYSAVNPAQNLLPSVLKYDGFGNMGFYTMALYYFSFGVFSFLATPIVRKFGDKWSIIVGCITYVLMIAADIFPALAQDNPDSAWAGKPMYGFTYFLLLFTAFLNGFGASLLYVAQGKYLSEAATPRNIGLFQSVNWTAGCISLFSGNLLASFLLKHVS
jgi:MFS family permease